ncbi:type II toxin-antitoxin system VapB family antitoxin [Gluconacetobacter diazotrophicus]|uniref:Type II toxin-antitoxin system VapB family antitoxin n=1 Tax=Gluconacetobacter diazotrophicus TaxID=33996 RepID=A0A7W4NH97_GLUDI|nr:type II toxin-antitoxin system VapB family antitoxin [Gluconacetobacter diazotrophicus]
MSLGSSTHLNIKNDEAHRLAAELARLTGERLTSTVTTALRERLDREQRRHGGRDVPARLMVIGRRYAELPDGPHTNPDAIIDYDENGVPR